MTQRQVRVGVGVIIYNEKNEVLIGLRKNSHGHGTWGFAGGHQEFGESPEQCAIRETEEETGVKMGNIRPLGFVNDTFPNNTHYITLFIEADHIEGSPINKEPHKLERWEWRTWDNLPSPLFGPITTLLESPFAAHIRSLTKEA